MTVTRCVWCDMPLRLDILICPECGTRNSVSNAQVGVARQPRSKVVRRGRRVVLAILAVPLMLSMAYAAHMTQIQMTDGPEFGGDHIVNVVNDITTNSYDDPVQRAVFVDGIKAVRQALSQPDFTGFQDSVVIKTAGNIVTLCGTVAGTVGYSGDAGRQRFISVFGQSAATTVEGADTSFDVLWTRLCTRDEGTARPA